MKIDYSDECMAAMVANIIGAWSRCTADDITEGWAWYATARETAELVGNGDINMGAGILAALSPQMPWDRNVKLAFNHARGITGGCLGNSSRKAAAIADGADPITVIVARKTRAFHANIIGDLSQVTVDTHAYSIATGDMSNPSMTDKQYDFIADAYRVASARLGVPAAVAQAATWCWFRREVAEPAVKAAKAARLSAHRASRMALAA